MNIHECCWQWRCPVIGAICQDILTNLIMSITMFAVFAEFPFSSAAPLSNIDTWLISYICFQGVLTLVVLKCTKFYSSNASILSTLAVIETDESLSI